MFIFLTSFAPIYNWVLAWLLAKLISAVACYLTEIPECCVMKPSKLLPLPNLYCAKWSRWIFWNEELKKTTGRQSVFLSIFSWRLIENRNIVKYKTQHVLRERKEKDLYSFTLSRRRKGYGFVIALFITIVLVQCHSSVSVYYCAVWTCIFQVETRSNSNSEGVDSFQ